MLLDEKIGNIGVNSTMTFDDVVLLERLSEQDKEDEDDWDVSEKIQWWQDRHDCFIAKFLSYFRLNVQDHILSTIYRKI